MIHVMAKVTPLLLLLLLAPCVSHKLFSCDENHDGSCDPIEKLSETFYKNETGSVWWILVIALPTLVGLLLIGLVYKCMANNDDDKETTRKDCKMNVLFSALDQAFAAHTTTTTTTTSTTATATTTTTTTI